MEMTGSSPAAVATFISCAAANSLLVALILLQARRSRTGLYLAAAAGTTVIWAAASATLGASAGVAAAFDLLHILAWFGFCLHLYRRASDPGGAPTLFAVIGLCGAMAAAAITLLGLADLTADVDLLSPAILLRLGVAIAQLLLLENYWRAQAPERPSHLTLACVALGGLAAYDLVVCADAALFRTASPTLLVGRGLVAALVVPLLALAAARNRDWRIDIHVSRTAAFHSATLVVSGVFLLALGAVGELARYLAESFGIGWGSLAEICLLFAGVLTIAMLLVSAPARNALRRGFVDHFFTHRYDYRREWQHCIDILTKAGSGPLQERVIRALADAVDSPAGLLFMREPGQAGLAWAGAWNTAPAATLPIGEDRLAELLSADRPLELPVGAGPVADGFAPWLAVPLRDIDPATPGAMGVILLARARSRFVIDGEVVSLLRILAHEVAIHLAQQRATAALLQTRDLRAYGERFAFVAHDIKNVSSQLSLLLSNAEIHIADPEFQKDMLGTVRASIGRIGGLIRRLEPAREAATPALLDPAPLLALLVRARPPGGTSLALDIDASAAGVRIVMEEMALQAAVAHLLDNALNAAGAAGRVSVTLHAYASRVAVEITDDGPGMTAEFVRDHLFAPFATRTVGGTGLGAFQARELLRAAGGELSVRSAPGAGTTMCLLLPRVDAGSGGLNERSKEEVLF